VKAKLTKPLQKFVKKLAYFTPAQAIALDNIAQDIADRDGKSVNVNGLIRRYVEEGIARDRAAGVNNG
jgi:hypothetical protein